MFKWEWFLKDGYPDEGIDRHMCKVFGTFVCGGGSTMGYKRAGFEHLGGVEFDKKMASIYQLNHKPKHLFIEDIRLFNQRTDLPDELYELDLLDGSPPCSLFSTAGKREKDWGKEKKFSEGQSLQTLDDLILVYCDTIEKLRPKTFVLENVTGLIKGNGKHYAKAVFEKLCEIGYDVQVFNLNAASMGLPQARQRIFFIGIDGKFKAPKLDLHFDCDFVPFKRVDAVAKKYPDEYKELSPLYAGYWNNTPMGKPVGKFNSASKKADWNKPVDTLSASSGVTMCHCFECRNLSKNELILVSSFPIDYNFEQNKPDYVMGMSVPPVMTAQISYQIYLQWLSKI